MAGVATAAVYPVEEAWQPGHWIKRERRHGSGRLAIKVQRLIYRVEEPFGWIEREERGIHDVWNGVQMFQRAGVGIATVDVDSLGAGRPGHADSWDRTPADSPS